MINGKNFKRIDFLGDNNFEGFNRDHQNNITDNLIIKGENLNVLEKIKSEFSNKIKLIYIDPPYNTKNEKGN